MIQKLLPTKTIFAQAVNLARKEAALQKDKEALLVNIDKAIVSQKNTLEAITASYNDSMAYANGELANLEKLKTASEA